MKTFRSEDGNTLLLILVFVTAIGLAIAPLFMRLNVGLLHAVTDGNAEQAYTKSESVSAIFTRLLAAVSADSGGVTAEDIMSLKDQLQSIGLIADISVVTDADGNPIAVRFSDASGANHGRRSDVVVLNLAPPSDDGDDGGDGGDGDSGSGDGPAAGSSGDEFYFQHGVVKDNTETDRYFASCPADPGGTDTGEDSDSPDDDMIDDHYDPDEYQDEFNTYADYYLGANFDSRFAARPLPDTPEPVPDEVGEIDDTVTQPSTYVLNASGPGIAYAGPVQIDGNWQDSYTISALANGSAVEAAGDLSIIDLGKDVTLDGALKVGGDLTVGGMKSLTINGDVLVRGTVQFGGYSNLTIHGRLIAEGGITFGNSGTNLIVDGGIITGADLSFREMKSFESGAAVNAAGQIAFNGYVTNAAIGQWDSGGNPLAGDGSGLVAGASLTTNGVATLKTTGDMSAPTMNHHSQIQTLYVGGSILTDGSVNFPSTMQNWSIVGHLSVGGTLTTGSMRTLTIGKSLYAVGGIAFSDITDFRIGGSLLSQGVVHFSNTIAKMVVSGDVIATQPIDFVNITDLQIGGTLASEGDITFGNTIKSVFVGGDLVTKDSMSLTTIDILFRVQGYMIALSDISFNNNINQADVTLGGFYAGGTTTFPNWFENGGSDGAICIQYQDPDTGGSGGSGGSYSIGDRTTSY